MRVVALLLVILLSGCLMPSYSERGELAGERNLLATSAFVAHSGAGGVTLVSNGTVPRPDSCVLYRGEGAYGVDECRVMDGSPDREIQAPWHIAADWEGSDASAEDTMERLHEKSVLTFDADGEVLGEWSGRDPGAYHERFAMAIE